MESPVVYLCRNALGEMLGDFVIYEDLKSITTVNGIWYGNCRKMYSYFWERITGVHLEPGQGPVPIRVKIEFIKEKEM